MQGGSKLLSAKTTADPLGRRSGGQRVDELLRLACRTGLDRFAHREQYQQPRDGLRQRFGRRRRCVLQGSRDPRARDEQLMRIEHGTAAVGGRVTDDLYVATRLNPAVGLDIVGFDSS